MSEPENNKAVTQDLRTEEEKEFDAEVRVYANIPEPMNEKDNPDALFANGWGRRGHFALLVAPSGVGKSVISTQLFVPWANGKPALVGSAPLNPLRLSLIQAEDDDTEMAEFRRDHRLGHLAEGVFLTEDVAVVADDVNLLAILLFVVELGFAAGEEQSCRHQDTKK